VYPWEDWILAKSAIGDVESGIIESDLFDGIRENVGASA
jgi:hypothetical protein